MLALGYLMRYASSFMLGWETVGDVSLPKDDDSTALQNSHCISAEHAAQHRPDHEEKVFMRDDEIRVTFVVLWLCIWIVCVVRDHTKLVADILRARPAGSLHRRVVSDVCKSLDLLHLFATEFPSSKRAGNFFVKGMPLKKSRSDVVR